MSLTGVPRCWWRTTSESMNTVHCSPQSTGCSAGKGQTREIPLDADAELFRLFFKEAARPGGAGLVHGEILDEAVLQPHVLGILPPDLENSVHLRADERRSRGMAVISLTTTSAPARSPMRWRPEPVTPTACTSANSPYRSRISRNPVRTASMGRLAVMR